MSSYSTRFSCVLPLETASNIERAYAAFARYEAALQAEDETPDFKITHDARSDGAELLISSGDCSGDPDKVAEFVGLVAKVCGLEGRWGFVWAYTCDRDRTDGFGGGAMIIDLGQGRIVDSLSCDRWLIKRLAEALTLPGPGSVRPVALPKS